MYFRVRKFDAKSKDEDLCINMSKMGFISDLRKLIEEKISVDPKRQILFFRGKQLVDDHKIFDYDIQLNDIVQLMVKPEKMVEDTDVDSKQANDENEDKENIIEKNIIENKDDLSKVESRYYKIQDPIDVFTTDCSGWLEGEIMEILGKDGDSEDNFIFVCKLNKYGDIEPLRVKFKDIRPRSYYIYKREELKPGMEVMANYNVEEPNCRGHWFDVKIQDTSNSKIEGTAYISEDLPALEVKIKFSNEIMRIEKPYFIEERTRSGLPRPEIRQYAVYCKKCKDDPEKNCKFCGCKVCSVKKDAAQLLLCDECDQGYHLYCLTPPLTEVPSDPEWYCPSCKTNRNEIVNAGEKLKISSKKAKMQSNKNSENAGSTRDWGRGMACVGRTKECTLVSKNHYGPIPGVEVGTCWKFRVQVSESGIHRPHVAGIHGKEADGAYSLVLAGGYEDDVDNGEEFFYTGSGGRDLSGNKRVNVQSSDQKLTHMNKALALNCNAKFNDKVGAEASDWKAGKPVRVVRNYKLAKHSKYAPKDGNRYDGIYKVVKYFPEKGQSGFIVWRYLLRRDDPTPAPWEDNAPVFEMIYPPGYLEAQANTASSSKPKKDPETKTKKDPETKSKKDPETKSKKDPETPKEKKNGSKRKTLEDFILIGPKPKQTKNDENKQINHVIEVLGTECEKTIKNDKLNEKLWDECFELIKDGKKAFLDKVGETFLCICCQEVVFEPITTECKHNICKNCLLRSFKAEVFTCPCCRHDLNKSKKDINQELFSALKLLFPGYEIGR